MQNPSIQELSHNNKYNRYMLVMMAAKGAKFVTDKMMNSDAQTDVFAYPEETMKIDTNEKPIKNAVRLFHEGEIMIKLSPEAQRVSENHMAECAKSEDISE